MCFLAQQVDLCFQVHLLERICFGFVCLGWGFFCCCLFAYGFLFLRLLCKTLLANCPVLEAEMWGVWKEHFLLTAVLSFTLKAYQSNQSCRKICGNQQGSWPCPSSVLAPACTCWHTHVRTHPALTKWKRWCELIHFDVGSADTFKLLILAVICQLALPEVGTNCINSSDWAVER